MFCLGGALVLLRHAALRHAVLPGAAGWSATALSVAQTTKIFGLSEPGHLAAAGLR
eukprot:ctg_7577.g542